MGDRAGKTSPGFWVPNSPLSWLRCQRGLCEGTRKEAEGGVPSSPLPIKEQPPQATTPLRAHTSEHMHGAAPEPDARCAAALLPQV